MKVPPGPMLLLIDASSYLHRAFHAVPDITRRRDGLHTGAINGMAWTFMKLLRLNWSMIGRLPDYVAVVMDSRQVTFRHEIYPEYKNQREAYPIELEDQIPYIPVLAEAFNVKWIRVDGMEADDIIATYVSMAEMEGLVTVIASSDKDLMQLVSETTVMYDAMADKTDRTPEEREKAIVGIPQVIKKWGVPPELMIDLQAIMGDTTDNVPGVHKYGPKKSAALLQAHGNLQNMLDAIDFGEDYGFKNRAEFELFESLTGQIELARDLVTLKRNCVVPYEIEDLEYQTAHDQDLIDFFDDMEWPQLKARVNRTFQPS